MKLLQLCHKMPFPVCDGGAYSLYHTAMGLAREGVDVRIFAVNTPKDYASPGDEPAEYNGLIRFESCRIDTRVKMPDAFINLFGNKSYFASRFWSPVWNERLKLILQSEEFDIIQLEHLYMCLYLETIRQYSGAKVILRPQNVESKTWATILEKSHNPLKKKYLRISASRLLKFEREMAGRVDGMIAISAADEETFRTFAPNTPVVAIPAGFDFMATNPEAHHRRKDQDPVFYHLGSMDWIPNVQGMKWFLDEIYPHIRRDYPGFTFRIAGKNMPEWLFRIQDDHFIVEGEVMDAGAYHATGDVMIVPLISGGGLRVKIIEGMALGKTIISTPEGVSGIPCTNMVNILIASTKEEFSTQVMKCVESREFCLEIGRNARRFAIDHYDRRLMAQKMVDFYGRIVTPPHPKGLQKLRR